MACHQLYLAVSLLCVSVGANFYYDRVNYDSDYPFQKSLTFKDRSDDIYEFSSSENLPIRTRFSQIRERAIERRDAPREPFVSATKKVPKEKKYSKKVLSPLYTYSDKRSGRYNKYILPMSVVPYCSEIETKLKKSSPKKDTVICYKCKDPTNGSIHERCSHALKPFQKYASRTAEGYAASPPLFRNKREGSEDEISSSYGGSNSYKKLDNPFRFSDRIFEDVAESVPENYKNKDEKCEKVVKDSMVCMLCKDAKTNGQYEQCSYVNQPKEKAYSYTKSSSFKNPEALKAKEEQEEEEGKNYEDEVKVDRDHDRAEVKPVREERGYSYPDKDSYVKESSKQRSSEGSEAEETSDNCKRVERDSKTCTVCKDPKTGGNYEKCSYSFQPNDKIYKFSRSKSFGYPQGSSSKETEEPDYDVKPSEAIRTTPSDESAEYKRDYTIPESYYDKYHPASSELSEEEEKPSSSYREAPRDEAKSEAYKDEDASTTEYTKSESERATENVSPSNCEKTQKGSMTCTSCKDPKTGGKSEKCSYNYQPNDKLYSYSKSFGTPSKGEGRLSSYDKSGKLEKLLGSPFDKERSFDSPSGKSSYVAAGDSKREFRELSPSRESNSEAEDESEDESEKAPSKAIPKKVDVNFYDAYNKKAEIEKFLQEFRKEDRSNCKKVMRDKMTCYQCTDEKGFQKEECAFTTPEDSNKKLTYREVKEFQTEEPAKKVPRSTGTTRKPERRAYDFPLEPDMSASETWHVNVKREKPVEEHPEEIAPAQGDSKEVEPYEYADETRPVFDKVLGLTLPAYMLTMSEDEAEFDKIVSSSRI